MNPDIDYGFDAKLEFPEFYDSDFVKKCGPNRRWTVSNNKKVPIRMDVLDEKGEMRNLVDYSYPSLDSLEECLRIIPNAANHTYVLNAIVDGYVVLDIEPSCPEDIRRRLLAMPYEYGEISMSGKGYHLVFPLPDCIYDYPDAVQKRAMKEKNGYYEIHLAHNITFTRNAIPDSTGTEDFEPMFRELCSEQKPSVSADFDIDSEEPEIPMRDALIRAIKNGTKYNKTPEDFPNDKSGYEFGLMMFLAKKMSFVTETAKFQRTGHVYTDNERAWVVYLVAKDLVPYREKHDNHIINGIPYLLYSAMNAVASFDEKQRKLKEENVAKHDRKGDDTNGQQ